MKTNKLLIASALLAAGAATTACDSTDDPSYEMNLQRNMLVATTVADGSAAVRTNLTGVTIGMDMYDNTTGSLTVNNVVMPGGATVAVAAAPLRFSLTTNQMGYLFQPQATTAYTGLAAPSSLTFYMGGMSQINTRLHVVDGATTIVGYGSAMYFFTSSATTGGSLPLNTTDATENVIQVALQNGAADGQYQATIYWLNPRFDSGVSESRTLAIPGLTAAVDPEAGMLTITGGADAPIVPRLAETSSTTLGKELTEYAISNATMIVGDLTTIVGRLTFDLDYLPADAEEGAAPTTYHYSATLREGPEL